MLCVWSRKATWSLLRCVPPNSPSARPPFTCAPTKTRAISINNSTAATKTASTQIHALTRACDRAPRQTGQAPGVTTAHASDRAGKTPVPVHRAQNYRITELQHVLGEQHSLSRHRYPARAHLRPNTSTGHCNSVHVIACQSTTHHFVSENRGAERRDNKRENIRVVRDLLDRKEVLLGELRARSCPFTPQHTHPADGPTQCTQ